MNPLLQCLAWHPRPSRSRSCGGVFRVWGLILTILGSCQGWVEAADSGLSAVLTEESGTVGVQYWVGSRPVARSTMDSPAGVDLQMNGGDRKPLRFSIRKESEGRIELGPERAGGMKFRWTLIQRSPDLIERTLEVTAEEAARFSVSFSISPAIGGDYCSFSGSVRTNTLFDTVRGSPRLETFPVGLVRGANGILGLAAESPGLWENRCQILVAPEAGRITIFAGDGRPEYPLILKPPEDARDTYQYRMDGWQNLVAGATRRFTTWLFVSPGSSQYDAQLAAHLAVANARGWNSSTLEAILRNTSFHLLRRNLALDAEGKPRDGKYIFISGPGYGWKQWVTDGFYTALGLDDPEKTIESNRAVFWTRMDYEDNAQYYLIWAVLMKRAGGSFNRPLVEKAYEFIRRNEKDGYYIPPPLPGSPNARGWKTYHDVLLYDHDDCPTSNQGFHCGALLAARELGLGVTQGEIDRSIASYRSLFNQERQFFPTSRKQRDTLGQDTLYGATLTYAVFGVKLLPDDLVTAHFRTSEKVKTPYGLRVISQADGSLLPGHSGVYCYGGSWFLNDAANYLLAGVHGVPGEEVNKLLVERILREIESVPAFNESISTVDGHPHGHILYSWNSGFWWLRKQIRSRMGEVGPDPIGVAVDARLGVLRQGGFLSLDPSHSRRAGFGGQKP